MVNQCLEFGSECGEQRLFPAARPWRTGGPGWGGGTGAGVGGGGGGECRLRVQRVPGACLRITPLCCTCGSRGRATRLVVSLVLLP